MLYKSKLILFLMFTLLLLSAGATLELSPAEAQSGEDVIPKEVACSFREEDFYSFLVDKIAQKVAGDINDKSLDSLKAKILDPSAKVIPANAGIECLFSEDSCFRRNEAGRNDSLSGMGSMKKVIEEELKSKDSIEYKYAKLTTLKMVMDGEKFNVCGSESQSVVFEGGSLSFNLNEFRTMYHKLWLADLYLWFKNRHPNLDQKLYEEARKWRAPMPIFIEGATGDKSEDGRRKRDVYTSTRKERLEKISSEYKKKSIQWFVVDWSKSGIAIDGKISHPSIIDEHKNFSAQFLGAVELVHLMSIALESGEQLQVMAFSAGANVVLMASEIYKGLGKSGVPFKNVILVQGSIYQGRDLTPLTELTKTRGRVVVTRNREDSFYLGAGTKSLGVSGGMELFGKGDSIGFNGTMGGSQSSKVEVWDIYDEPMISKGRKPLLHSEFRDSKFTDTVEEEHWRWFSPYNFRRLIKLFFF